MEIKKKRLLSLDAFRGLTIVGMILVNHPGSWGHVYPPLRHATWHGLTPTDLIFPFFIFITGISIVFALGGLKESGASQSQLIGKLALRSLVIFLLGLLFYLWPDFNFAEMRIPGVLQRIALVYFFSSLIFLKTDWKQQASLVVIILLGYWALMSFVPVPGIGPANLEPETNLGAWLDQVTMKGHLYRPNEDPEGLLGTLPAIATGLLGILTGTLIRSKKINPDKKVVWLFVSGSLLSGLGYLWDLGFPINKNLWTSSFVVVTAGLGLIVFALCYWFFDVLEYGRFARPAVVYGTNAIAIYMVAHMFAGAMASLIQIPQSSGESVSLYYWIYKNIWASWLSPLNASLAFALSYALVWMAPLWYMHKKKIFIKV